MSNFNIKIDYRYDTNGFFKDPVKKAVLESAARVWESYIQDELPNAPVGTQISFINPANGQATNFTLDSEVDDLVIFVGARALDGTTLGMAGTAAISYSSNSAIASRDFGDFFAPVAGTIVFDSTANWFFDSTPDTTNDIPSRNTDFFSVALHEIGHTLGLTYANESLISNGYFNGERAKALNGGNPIPLDETNGHIEQGFLLNGNGATDLMQPALTNGTAARVGALDLAMLADIGYEIATEGSDRIVGKNYADNLNGLDGDDNIIGNAGNDTVLGLNGNDTIYGNQNNDLLFGNIGQDLIYGGDNEDTIQGGKENDTLLGENGNDVIYGNLGDDYCYGGAGDDIFYGGRDRDTLTGEAGNDILSGDRGDDTLTGGTGRDTFVFRAESGIDIITDFSVGEDIIQVATGLGFNTGSDLLGAITSTGTSTDGRRFSVLTLSPENNITIFSNNPLTGSNFIIAGETTI